MSRSAIAKEKKLRKNNQYIFNLFTYADQPIIKLPINIIRAEIKTVIASGGHKYLFEKKWIKLFFKLIN